MSVQYLTLRVESQVSPDADNLHDADCAIRREGAKRGLNAVCSSLLGANVVLVGKRRSMDISRAPGILRNIIRVSLELFLLSILAVDLFGQTTCFPQHRCGKR